MRVSVYCEKTADSIEMPFGIVRGVGEKNCIKKEFTLAPPGKYD